MPHRCGDRQGAGRAPRFCPALRGRAIEEAPRGLYGAWQVRDGARLSAGIENLLDRRYADHLAGYNQVSGSDVATGARLPGPGRGAFVRLSFAR